jgi:hypothetical protein
VTGTIGSSNLFRKDPSLQGLFGQVLEMALESGTIKLGRVSLDGTKVTANASEHKAMSYGLYAGQAAGSERRSPAV